MLGADATGRTKGEIVLAAIEASYEQIVAAHGRERTGLFAAAGRSPERRHVGDPRKVAVTVSEAEAEILAGVLGQTTLGLSASRPLGLSASWPSSTRRCDLPGGGRRSQRDLVVPRGRWITGPVSR